MIESRDRPEGWRAGIALMALATGAGALLLATGVSLAHTVKYDSTVTIERSSTGNQTVTAWTGVVQSDRAKCLPGRIVKVYRVDDDGPDTFLGSDDTAQVGEAGGAGSFTV